MQRSISNISTPSNPDVLSEGGREFWRRWAANAKDESANSGRPPAAINQQTDLVSRPIEKSTIALKSPDPILIPSTSYLQVILASEFLCFRPLNQRGTSIGEYGRRITQETIQ